MIEITIDNKKILCEEGKTILEVAKENNIHIPTLCYLKGVMEDSNCRICVVENQSNHKLLASCGTKVYNGLNVVTKSQNIVNSRKNTLKLINSVHHRDCENCVKNENCTLKDLFDEYEIAKEENPFFSKHNYKIDKSSPCIVRDNNKCILCNRCANVCSKTQCVSALTREQRGFNTFMGCAYNNDMKDSPCVGCGQCTLVCPTGALVEHSEMNEVRELINNKDYFVVAQIAPSVRVSLAEAFKNEVGTFDENKMVEALKLIGFDKVFDINLGADFTVIEETNELVERIKENKNLPQFSSCCPAWFKYVQTFYPNQTKHLSSCKSPTEMLGVIIKNYYAQKENICEDKIKVVGIMPCTAKKGEKERAKDVDAVLTTRELALMIKESKIDYNSLSGKPFDTALSGYTGGGLIFGVTGGVTEAVLRNACHLLSPNEQKIDFVEVRNSNGRKDVLVKCGYLTLSLCIVNGLSNAKKVMEDIISGKKQYHFVEVMACPGGCINGGGQCYVDYSKIPVEQVKALRSKSIYEHDKKMTHRTSHENSDMQKIYEEFFIPSKNKAKQLLHYKED